MPVLDFFLSEKKINPYFFKNHCYFMSLLPVAGAFQVALVVKNLPANAGDLRDVRDPLGWEDPLEEGMALFSNSVYYNPFLSSFILMLKLSLI